MGRRLLPWLAAAGLIFTSIALAQTPEPGGLPDRRYHHPQTLPRILPVPPPAGSGRAADDTADLRQDPGAERRPALVAEATLDAANLTPRAGMFACALGVTLDAANAPGLDAMLHRMAPDARAVVDPPKDSFNRPRPYVGAAGDPVICVPKTESLAKSASYPSGHATVAWAWGLILAELAPDRATEILRRAREIGDSRIICGVHYLSDVEEGRTNGSILVAALHSNSEFRADLEKARAEVGAARQTPHVGPGDCLDTDQASQHPPY